MNVVFLYTELAAYTRACLQELAERVSGITVIHYRVNSEAPFRFESGSGINYIEGSSLDAIQLISIIERVNPSVIFCSGWNDKRYLTTCRYFKKKKNIPAVLCMDNRWEISLRKIAAVIFSPFFIRPYFTAAWVPGKQQAKYAGLLGIRKGKIFTGFYCADTKLWGRWFEEFRDYKKKNFPKVILYAGRYYEFKGLPELWSAFEEFKKGKGKEWNLWCLGTGSLTPEVSDGIKHFGFIQPSEMKEFIQHSGIFVFPSRFEPWGVAVHEFAAAGFPLLLSSEVGAKEMFLKENQNGFAFKAGNSQQLLNAMNNIAELSNEELNKMSEESNRIALSFTLKDWTEKVFEISNTLKR